MIPALKRYLAKRNGSKEADLELIKLHNGAGYRNPKVSFVALKDGVPFIFLKTTRSPSHDSRIQQANEALKLAHLAGQTGMPDALWLDRVQGVLVSAETMIRGTALDPENSRDISEACSWLLSFQLKSERKQMTLKEAKEHYLNRLREIGRLADELPNLDKILDGVPQEQNLPSIVAHGDFTPGNILRDEKGELCVIDWDGFGKINWPLFDLLTLLDRSRLDGETKSKIVVEHMSRLGINQLTRPFIEAGYALLSRWRKL